MLMLLCIAAAITCEIGLAVEKEKNFLTLRSSPAMPNLWPKEDTINSNFVFRNNFFPKTLFY